MMRLTFSILFGRHFYIAFGLSVLLYASPAPLEMAGIPQFINKLFKLVHAPAGQSFIAWNEDGTQFWVTNIEGFSRDVLPMYFKHNNYASFVRQLNLYGELVVTVER